MWLDFFFMSMKRAALFWTRWSLDGGVGKARVERVAVVNSGQNERDKFVGSFSGQAFSDLTDATKMEVAGPGSGRDKVVEGDTEVLDCVRDEYLSSLL